MVDTCGTAHFCDMTLTATVRRAAICSPPHPQVKKILVHYNSDKTLLNLTVRSTYLSINE